MNTTSTQTASPTILRNGNRAAYITTQTDGTYRVACFIEYRDGDRSWCDGATYKPAAGATRKAKAFTT